MLHRFVSGCVLFQDSLNRRTCHIFKQFLQLYSLAPDTDRSTVVFNFSRCLTKE